MKKTLFSLAATLSLSLALTSCGGGATPPTPVPPVVDSTAPSVVSVTPSSGATGVSKDANVVVTFSEPMDQASAQAAFQSADLGTATFSWSADGTAMTVNPNADLAYTSSGKSYSFKVTTTAKDKANNALGSETSSSFKTFRQLSSTVTSTAALDGDANNAGEVFTTSNEARAGDGFTNRPYRAFFSFDISSLPAGVEPANIVSATLNAYQSLVAGTPYASLKSGPCLGVLSTDGSMSAQGLPPIITPIITPIIPIIPIDPIILPLPLFGCDAALLEHVSYGSSLTGADFETPVLSALGNLSSGKGVGMRSEDVLSALQNDLENRSARGNRSQYRVRFPLGTNTNNSNDFAYFNTGDAASNKPTLEVTYLIP